ncbi:unnamed protein product [Microthlaspi erraticum]|uniref:DUF223 domain-containing protein n=1 Tax=Microthlaspi erraticum TaxID=1685480 RepID=A0A6D2IVY9_9BRAS|nr:unnamed protein product [Microthlaspi erraticum]
MQPLFSQEGDWILLGHLDLTPVTGELRLTPHEFKMECKRSTIIKKFPHGISDYRYSFVSFEDIKIGIVDPAFSVDLIEKVKNVGNFFNREYIAVVDKKKVCLYLRNERGSCIAVVIQRSHALDIVCRLMDYTETTVVCVVRFGRIIKSGGVWSAHAVDPYSHVALDPNREFRCLIADNEKQCAKSSTKEITMYLVRM